MVDEDLPSEPDTAGAAGIAEQLGKPDLAVALAGFSAFLNDPKHRKAIQKALSGGISDSQQEEEGHGLHAMEWRLLGKISK